MKMILIFLPFLISLTMGYLTVTALFRKGPRPDPFSRIFLGGGLGLGLSALITYLSFLCLDHLNTPFVVVGHTIALGTVLVLVMSAKKSKPKKGDRLNLLDFAPYALLILAIVPVWWHAKHFPMGGWDAWQVWNFKAKFLLLGGEHWKNVFDPGIWRNSPHYPLLLPLINVWGWLFIKNPIFIVPLLTAMLFVALTAGLLFSALYRLTKSSWVILAPLLFLTLPFYGQLAISQYSDITLGFYALATLVCLIPFLQTRDSGYGILAAIFLGFLSFTKPEGMVAALVIGTVAVALIFLQERSHPEKLKRALLVFLGTLVLAALPTITFQCLYSPGNQTFINGLTSETHPITPYRYKMIGAYVLMEFRSQKWNGLWILLLVGLCLSGGKCFQRRMVIIPIFLAGYLGIVLFYYVVNTHFKIDWWLQVTFKRILFSLLPLVVFWTFSSLIPETKK